MKRCVKMAAVAESKPFCQFRPIKMESVEVLEVVEGKEEVRDACSFCCVMVGTLLVVPMIEIVVGPDLDSDISIGFQSRTILFFQSAELAAPGNGLWWSDEPQRRLECVTQQWLLIEEALQALQVSPLGLSFTDDDVAGAAHDSGQSAGWGMAE